MCQLSVDDSKFHELIYKESGVFHKRINYKQHNKILSMNFTNAELWEKYFQDNFLLESMTYN